MIFSRVEKSYIQSLHGKMVVSNDWKKANVVPFHKKDDKHSVEKLPTSFITSIMKQYI